MVVSIGRWTLTFTVYYISNWTQYNRINPKKFANVNTSTSTDSPFLRGTCKSQLLYLFICFVRFRWPLFIYIFLLFCIHTHNTGFSESGQISLLLVFNFSNWTMDVLQKRKMFPAPFAKNRAQQKRTTNLLFRFTSDVLVVAICCVLRWDDDEPQTEWKLFCAFGWHLWCLGCRYGCAVLRNVAEHLGCPMRNEWMNEWGLSVHFDVQAFFCRPHGKHMWFLRCIWKHLKMVNLLYRRLALTNSARWSYHYL